MSQEQKSSSDFRVLIAGGGIAGLTLANALQLAGIDYLLFERRNTITPQFGASIGIQANGARIMDQIGCYDDIYAMAEPIRHYANHRADGSYVESLDSPQLLEKRMGYDTIFLDRQNILEVLSAHLDKSKVLLEKDISLVEHFCDKVVIHCTDGSHYKGSILAGADGVNSKVRREMWRIAKKEEPGCIPSADTEAMTSEYKCLFGISSPMHNMPLGSIDVTQTRDTSTFCATAKDHKIYFFIFNRLPKVYKGDEIPKFTRKDADHFAATIGHLNIMPNGAITFADIWKNRTSYALVAIEEAEYKKWTWGRIACLGDSIHKMTPNAGYGANAAIESAAALANAIQAMKNKSEEERSTYEQVTECLKGYQKVREKRTSEVMKLANKITRIQAVKTFGDYLFGHHIGPNLGDAGIDMHSALVS